MTTKHNNDTFLTKKITNTDIYNKLLEHEEIFKAIKIRQDFTNGKVKKSLWVATTAMMIIFVVLGFLFQHINK